MKKVVILGGSGIGMIAASILEKKGFEVLGFLNDFFDKGHCIGKFKKIEVIGTTNDLSSFLEDKNTFAFIAYVGLQNEKETYNKIEDLNIPEEKFINIIDDTAIIPEGYC